jgi:hypothetical protein
MKPIAIAALGALGAAIAGAIAFAFRKNVAPAPSCGTEFEAAHHGGTRSMSSVDLVVLHSTEGNTAKGAAEWFATTLPGLPESKQPGSAHLIVDDAACYRALPDDVVPYGAPHGNVNGLHIEMAGFHNWTRQEWLSHLPTIEKAAGAAAAWGKKYGIPMRFVDAAGLRRGESGVTTHLELTQAFTPGGHVDPGTDFPLDVFFEYAGGSAPSALEAAA